MRYATVLIVLILSGCGMFTVGEGQFSGRLVDVSWEGYIFKSCETSFQFGEQSSSISRASTLDKEYCDFLSNKIGGIINVKYKTWAQPCCLRMDSSFELIR